MSRGPKYINYLNKTKNKLIYGYILLRILFSLFEILLKSVLQQLFLILFLVDKYKSFNSSKFNQYYPWFPLNQNPDVLISGKKVFNVYLKISIKSIE